MSVVYYIPSESGDESSDGSGEESSDQEEITETAEVGSHSSRKYSYWLSSLEVFVHVLNSDYPG